MTTHNYVAVLGNVASRRNEMFTCYAKDAQAARNLAQARADERGVRIRDLRVLRAGELERIELDRQIEALIAASPIPANRSVYGAYKGVGPYRGKQQCLVGYSWSRPFAGMRAIVYDAVLGAGESYEAALANAQKRITK